MPGIEEAVAEALGIPQASFPPSTVDEFPWGSARGDQGSFPKISETIVSENKKVEIECRNEKFRNR